MKHTLRTILITIMCVALPFTISSCDDDNTTTTGNTIGTGNGSGNGSGSGNTNSDCPIEGKTFRFIGTQTTVTESTSPVASTTSTDLSFDLTTEFRAAGESLVTGTLEVTKITVTVAGISNDVSTGLGVTQVNTIGSYSCSDSANTSSGQEITVVEDGITTKYTLTYTSDNQGTFVTTVTGTRDGVDINASSQGTFTEL